jgi:hypothetical protein
VKKLKQKVERLSTVHMQREQWSGPEKTKKKRRKRKKQTYGLAMLPVVVDGVVAADRGADWPVVLLSFSAFPFYFFFSSALFFLLFPVLFSLPLWSSQTSPGAAA